jgi:hypothetical protein
MTYYPTLAEDLQRAKEILDRTEGALFGADTYAVYKLLESFVEAIEQLQADYTETVRLYRERDAQAAHLHSLVQGALNATTRDREP